MKIFAALTGTLALCGALMVSPAHAADAVVVEEEAPVLEPVAAGWQFAIDPLYTWVPGLNGNIRVFGHDASIDITTRDVLHHVDDVLHALTGLYMGSGELRNGKFGLQYDIFYAALDGAKNIGTGPITGGVDLGFKMSMTTLAANYRFYETQESYLDAIAGIRIMNVETDLAITLGPLGISARDGDTWVDPLIGLKGRHNINENWYIKGSALYGGFNVSSHSLYDVSAFVGYEWANGIEIYGGWRQAYDSYDNGSFKWDVTMSGPMMGLTFKF